MSGSRRRQARGRTRTLVLALSAAVLAAAVGCSSALTTDHPAAGAPAPGTTASASAAPSGTPAATAPLSASAPERLEIPAIGVDTSLLRLGLAADRTVQVPPIAANAPAGWYDGSVTPGERGSAVILGHVTVGQYGDGVFLRLGKLAPGDRIEVTRADGTTADFTVTDTHTYAKSAFPDQLVYGPDPQPVLRLVTCAGSPDPATRTYPDNLVVTAVLTGSTASTAGSGSAADTPATSATGHGG
ncbi:sortase (surface protein transpeptidase) [Streptacidiphilus sp. MAP12-33]|uniref:class F sortase n=1 Tax=Streptacidiphilus sp. MAP12-33 TaxID=3156266 RepID=UPI0035118F52